MNIGKHMVKDVKPTWKRRDQEFQANMDTYHCIVDCISHAVVLLKTSRVQTKQSPKTKKILQIYLKLALLNNKNCCLDSVFATEMEGVDLPASCAILQIRRKVPAVRSCSTINITDENLAEMLGNKQL